MWVGIVGAEAAKFTGATEADARQIIRGLLHGATALVSGRCHLGGIDVWAEEEANLLGIATSIFPPRVHTWAQGYRPRNLQIARSSDVVYCVTVRALPTGYTGMRFDGCYHCVRLPADVQPPPHVKSGGCWTAIKARELGKRAEWRVIG